jgi:hypothetical protein
MQDQITCSMLALFVLSSTLLYGLGPHPTTPYTAFDARSSAVLSARTSLTGVRIKPSELEALKSSIGVYEVGKDYSQVVDGHGTGLRPPTETEWTEIGEMLCIADNSPTVRMTELSASIDLTVSPWFPPIGDQDGQGSCTCWSIGYYMKTFQEAKEHGWDLSQARWGGGYPGQPTDCQDEIFSPSFLYHLINWGENHGSSPFDAISLIGRIGVCSWEKMPYDPNDAFSWPSEAAWREAPYYRGDSSIEIMYVNDDNGILDLKNWLASDELASIIVGSGRYQSLTREDLWTMDNYVNPLLDHMNTVVGYNDSIEYVEEGQVRHGAFKIANSWGKGWWEHVPDGCLWVSYEAMKRVVGYCIVYHDLVDYRPELFATFKVDHPRRNDVGVTVTMGGPFSPLGQKSFYFLGSARQPYCPNDVVFDITEFINTTENAYDKPFFLQVSDGNDPTTGVLLKFAVEVTQSHENATSTDTPLATTNNGYVFAAAAFMASKTRMSIDPSTNIFRGNETPPESTFTINLTVSDVTDLWAWVVNLTWNPMYLNLSDIWLPSDNVFNETGAVLGVTFQSGSVFSACIAGSSINDTSWTFNGTGTLCQIEMKILSPPSTLPVDCNLTLAQKYSSTFLLDRNLQHIVFNQENAYFQYAPPPDIALTKVESTKSVIGRGDLTIINVSIRNEAVFDETIRVALYANETQLTMLETSILGTESIVLTFTWNSSECMIGSYNISAIIEPVPSEIDKSDNVLLGNTVWIGLAGDLTADGRTDLRDLGTCCTAFDTSPGDPRWNPNADIDCSGKIDMRDISKVCSNFGKHYP